MKLNIKEISIAKIFKYRYQRYYEQKFKINVLNRLFFGKIAPQHKERIWIKTLNCTRATLVREDRSFGRNYSGTVRSGNWDQRTENLYNLTKIKSCFEHWVNGVPWNKTESFQEIKESYESGENYIDNIRTLNDLQARYRKLDIIFNEIKDDDYLKTSSKLGFPEDGLEHNGIYFHIDRNGNPIFAHAGNHRLAIALILEIPYIPAQVGIVHPDGLKHYGKLKDKSFDSNTTS
ncbi:hypothetical protein [Rhodohalobacter sp. 8-1]|uniref:hypothetical protein n=1 Tax=Rhodohalobacter sp. 8-1 TaxID=3131972 RepID=UPI0030EE5025